MPELSNQNRVANFNPTQIDTNSIKFKDKKREKNRVKKLKDLRNRQEARANRLKPVKVIKKSDPWSAKKRKAAIDKGFDVKSSVDAESDDEDDWNDDWEEFSKEKKLRKRLKKGKISKKHYNKEMDNISAIDEFKQFTASVLHPNSNE